MQKYRSDDIYFLLCLTKWVMVSIYLIAKNIHFDHFISMVTSL